MQENNSQNVKNILTRLKGLLNLDSDGDLTVFFKVGQSTISSWKARNTMNYDELFAICNTHDFDLNYVINGNQDNKETTLSLLAAEPTIIYQPVPVPVTINQYNEDVITIVSHKAAAGYLNGYADPEYISRLPTIQAPGYRDGIHRGFEIRGNSMPPLHSGSYSVGRLLDGIDSIRDRRVHIIVSKYDGIVIKRVIKIPHERTLVLVSDNPDKKEHPNQQIDYDEVLQVFEWRGALINSLPDPSNIWDRLNDYEARITMLENRSKN